MPKINIHTKLFIFFLTACLLSVFIVLAIFRAQFHSAFLDYLHETEEKRLDTYATVLIDYYSRTNSWDELKHSPRKLHRILRQAKRSYIPPHKLDKPPPPLPSRLLILDQDKQLIIGKHYKKLPHNMRPILYQGKVIASIGSYPRTKLYSRINQNFAERLDYLLWLAALVSLILTLIFAFILSRLLVKPIYKLREATQKLSQGQYGAQLEQTTQDELGQLTADFNELSKRLHDHEQSRQQWIMDIAHELRTPLAILRGEIEAIQDGISQVDSNTIDSLHQEVTHLSRLVDDLYQLSISDNGALNYHKEKIELTALLNDCMDSFSTSFRQKQITVDFSYTQAVWIQADSQRLQQLFHNLLKNTLRYTDSPGQLQVKVTQDAQYIHLCFADSSPSVPNESLPRLFERLYRVDASRNRATGGAGIGLSLCANIVKAHHGSITAKHADLGGLAIHITLPINH